MPDRIFSSMRADSSTAIKWTSFIIGCIILVGVAAGLFCSKCKKMLQRRKSRNTVAASPAEFGEHELAPPSLIYTHQGSGKIQCSGCHNMIRIGDTVQELPVCKHVFHTGCISSSRLHSNANSTCPLCQSTTRAVLDRNLKASPSEPA